MDPIIDPKIVPIPPYTDVPPMKTEASVFIKYPSPVVVQKNKTSKDVIIPTNAAVVYVHQIYDGLILMQIILQ